ncbi:uncharacterized protein LOC117167015 [Belonocnema kinseyi]|uniref:uncharacterized protein LOC117167015 n=1 Tax=Belonocnema kinseyi TaxID=2817044 RepID=UPI00143D8538|nr:uncharacterized protein LOC117167015 [Belonocnema kinseyi]
MSYRKEIEEMKVMKPQIERAVHKFLGFGEPSIVNTAVNCINSGFDKRKTADKLSALLDERKAIKLTEKIFIIYDDAKAKQRSKKRSHSDSKDKEKDVKKAKIKEDGHKNDKNDKSDRNDRSDRIDRNEKKDKKEKKDKTDDRASDQITQMMRNAKREISERQKVLDAIKKDDVLPPVRPSFRAPETLQSVSSMFNHGLLTKSDSETARKIALLNNSIVSKLNSGLLASIMATKPTPLILDESGKTVDVTGKEIQLTQPVPTLKANIRAKRRDLFKTQMQESKPEEIQESTFFDSRIGVKPAIRLKRALKFHDPGKFQQLAHKIRMKAQLEKLQNEISQIARKTGISSATKLALIAPKTEALNEDVPNMEWWDSVILVAGYPSEEDLSAIKISTITNLVEHPFQIRSPTEPLKPSYMPVFLTKKERKKLRRQTRRETWKEEQEKIRLGLEAPPEPKLRISNLMRVLGTEAVSDPTKIEAHVRQQMAKRLKAHEDANAARRLTAEQRREKNARKLKEDTTLGVHVAVYRIRDLFNKAKMFKVETNAKQLYLTGCMMLFRDCNVVVVEGGAKQLSKYKRLMLHRIKWEEDIVKDTDGNDVPNKCVLVWEGTSKSRHFNDVKTKVCPIERAARDHFKKHQVEHYWDLAYSGAVLDNTDDIPAYRSLALLAVSQCTILPTRMLQDLGRRANASMEKYYLQEQAIMDSGIHLSQGSPSWYLAASHQMSPASQNLSKRALRMETMAMMLVEVLKMTPEDAVSLLPSVGINVCTGAISNSLRMTAECKKVDPSYRTHTGRCNNALHPSWGAALESYTRFLPPEYQDGVSLPKSNLPSAREVSTKVHSGGPDIRHPYLMALTAMFGQFVAHDMAHTPRMELPNGERFKCCDVEFENFHPECFPIQAENAIGCMEYSRSAPHPGTTLEGCKLGPRQQINQASSYLDLSPIYGSSEETSGILREGIGGALNTQRKNLPMASKDLQNCRSQSKALPCFLSGDSRVNEHPGLALMHVLFLREHNRIAQKLHTLNPHWEDEKIYQETRKIVIAEMQHVTYNEFLPVILGEPFLDKFDLRLTPGGYFRGYDFRADATISNAAASAGFSFFVALTPKTLDLVDSRSTQKSGERSLLSAFYAPQELYEAGAIDRLITGATAGHSRKPFPPGLNEILLDRYFHDGKTNDVAVDYAAQMIQQGRDHGLPPYIKWRSYCDLPSVNEFRDLQETMLSETIERLQRVYSKVEEVDLVTGALSELPVEGSVLGPTFLCLLGKTFRNARLGDRYWYENEHTPGSFLPDQLEEIKKTTMARILCDNGDRLKRVQPRAFILKDPFLNEMTDCSIYKIDDLNLTYWQETKSSN